MPDTSRRDVLTGAAGLAAGSALSLPAPVLAQTEPFRIQPSADYLEVRRLMKLLAKLEMERHNRALSRERIDTWRGIGALHDAMRARLPRTPSDLLDHASRVLFHTVDRDLDDPCEAIARAGRSVTAREHAAFDLAWAVFVLAADRKVLVTAWPKWKPPMRDWPGTDI